VDADLDRRSAEGGGAHASSVTTTAFALAIVAAGLRKAFGDHVVLDGVDLCVPARLSLRCSARTVPARRPRSTSARHVDQMAAGNVLHVKVELDAANSPVKLLFQDDGNLVLYHNRLPALESACGQPLCLTVHCTAEGSLVARVIRHGGVVLAFLQGTNGRRWWRLRCSS
jgi:hypothetical protein